MPHGASRARRSDNVGEQGGTPTAAVTPRVRAGNKRGMLRKIDNETLGAADRGFSSRGYRKVHADYSAHAEELLEDESIPPGYRHYVRRYFQLIRPRDGEAPKR